MAALKALVIGMGVMIVVATVALVVLVVQRSGGGAATVASAGLVLDQPAGARIAGIAGLDRVLAIWVSRADGDRVILVDPASGRRTGEVRLRE